MYFIALLWLFVKSHKLKRSELFTEVMQTLQLHSLPVTMSAEVHNCLSIRHRHSLAEYNLGFFLPLDLTEVGKQARGAWETMPVSSSLRNRWISLMFLPDAFVLPVGELVLLTGGGGVTGCYHCFWFSVTSFSEWPFVAHLSCLQSLVGFILTQYVSEECSNIQCASMCVIPAKSGIFHVLVCF